MALPGNHLASRLTILLLKIRLLPTNPSQTRDYSQSNSIIIETKRHSHADTSPRRIHAHVEILDVLANDLDWDASHLDDMSLSSHVDSPQSCRSSQQGHRRSEEHTSELQSPLN